MPDPNRPGQQGLANSRDVIANPDSNAPADATEAFSTDGKLDGDTTVPHSPAPDATTVSELPSGAGDIPNIPGYRVDKEIARGGMGRVLAGYDLTLEREVAVKVLLPGSSANAAARFVTESKVTARLPHPGIPPVHALGQVSGGGPFLAMKLVRGRTLAYLLGNRPQPAHELARWVGVFEQVCQAVGFAHSQGILHRDLKPANVMVGAFAEVHVMDWGLAKDLSAEESSTHDARLTANANSPTNELLGATTAGQVMGTPSFMAPEQARAEVVNVQADVFALGGILSVILTGQPTFVGDSTVDVLKRAAGGKVESALRRLNECGADQELVELAQRCLSPDPAARPVSGQAVAEEVAAYRAGVEMRLREAQVEQAAGAARAAEQQKRRRVWAIAAAVVIAVLIIGGASAGWQWLRAETALERVTAEQQKTKTALNDLTASRDRNVRNLRRVTRQLIPDLVGSKPELSDSDRSFVQGLLPMWQELAADRGDTPVALTLRAEGHFSVAGIQENLGQIREAETSYRDALMTYQSLNDVDPKPENQRAVARAHNNLGLVLVSLGKVDEGLDEMRAALQIQNQLVTELKDDPSYQQDQALSRLNIGNQLGGQGDDVGSRKEYQAALEILQPLASSHPDQPSYTANLAGVHLNLGNLHHRLGNLSETMEQYQTAVKLLEGLANEYPNTLDYRIKLAFIRTNIGALLMRANAAPEAEAQYRQALGLREAIAARFPGVPEYRAQLASTHSNLAVLLAAVRRPAEAEKHYARAMELAKALVEQAPRSPEHRELLASTHDNFALLLSKKRDDPKRSEAERHHREALSIWKELRAEFPADPEYQSDMADSHNHLGLLLSNLGRYEEGERELREALGVWDGMVADMPERIEYKLSLAGASCNFANHLASQGEHSEGKVWFDKAISLLEPRIEAEPNDSTARRFLRNSYWGRAEAGDKLGHTAAANADWELALKLSAAQEKLILRGRRADSRARAGRAEESVQEIDAIASLIEWPPGNLFGFARVYAVASAKVDDRELSQQYADKAMATLRQAVKRGLKDADAIENELDLKTLHDRDDFQSLLEDLRN